MDNAKRAAGEGAVAHIQEGMMVGLGTGSTAYYFVEALGRAVQQGLQITGVATSDRTEAQAQALGIPVVSIGEVGFIDVTVDGADEFDPQLNLIKGGGGALYREKMVASLSREMIIIADLSKQVAVLGTFPLPVEVVPFGVEITKLRLHALNLIPTLRLTDTGEPFRTDNGNYILDCQTGEIRQPLTLHRDLKQQIGVVETGLFPHMATRVLLGQMDGSVKDILPQKEDA